VQLPRFRSGRVIEIAKEIEMLDAGEPVEVTLFGKLEPPDLLFVGSHCLGLDVLADLIDIKMRVINAGSSGGLAAIRRGQPI